MSKQCNKDWAYKGKSQYQTQNLRRLKNGNLFRNYLNTNSKIRKKNTTSTLACDKLTEKELEERIQYYTKRAEQRLPLFEKENDTRQYERDYLIICDGCGILSQHGRHAVKQAGWVKESLRHLGLRTALMWCKDCYQLQGIT